MNLVDIAKDFVFGFLEGIVKIIDNVVMAFTTAFDSILEFNIMLVDQQAVMQDMIDQINNGSAIDGVNLITFIGSYRWLVGDILFNYTYLLTIAGAGFIIYKLVYYIYKFMLPAFDKAGMAIGGMFKKFFTT